MQYSWYDLVGNAGVACVVVTYTLVQVRQMQATSLVYGILNAVGAALILVSLLFTFNLSAFLMEAFWLLSSIIGVRMSLKEREEGH